MLYAGPGGDGAVAGGMWYRHGGHAIDGGVLDSAVRHSGAAGDSGIRGERRGYQESAGAQDRRAGMPMVVEVTYAWSAEEFISARRGHRGAAYLLATETAAYRRRVTLHSAHAESADANERAIGQCDHGHQRGDRSSHPGGDPGGRAGCGEISAVARPACES